MSAKPGNSRSGQDYIRTFNRYELKYLLDYHQVQALREMIGGHVNPDAHAGRDGFYKISSVYYDSPELTSYWEKLDGEKFRRKVRLRTYGESPEEAFVEIKQRISNTVQKRRCRLPLAEAQAGLDQVCQGSYPEGLDPVFDEVYILGRRHALRPTLLVSYNRTAFFDRYKRDLRITLDRNIRCRHIDLDLGHKRLRGRLAVPPSLSILEVKFNEAIPRWLCTCLNRLDLKVVRLSKYCEGIQRVGLHLPLSERLENLRPV